MNGRLAKKIRRVARKNDLAVAAEFKQWVNSLGFMDRVRVAWRAILRKM